MCIITIVLGDTHHGRIWVPKELPVRRFKGGGWGKCQNEHVETQKRRCLPIFKGGGGGGGGKRSPRNKPYTIYSSASLLRLVCM